MDLKTKIHMITGFLGSGKTTLIKKLLSSKILEGKRVLILLYEEGEITIEENKTAIVISKNREPVEEELLEILTTYGPDHVLVEYNGMVDLEKFFSILEREELRKRAYLGKILATVEASTFDNYAKNLKTIYTKPLAVAEAIILKKDKEEEKLKIVERNIKRINRDAFIIKGNEDPLEKSHGLLPSIEKGFSLLLLYGTALFLFLLLRISSIGGMVEAQYSSLFAFSTIFISILLQAIPFILIGVLVSASIQVFVSQDFITSLFSKSTPLSMVMALLAGLFFPICDCAIIPVMSRLVKKGVPLAAAVTFMLAAPIVDPVVIASTLYAFPTMPIIAISRLLLGLTIALLTGLLFHFFPPKSETVREHGMNSRCTCGYCTVIDGEEGGDRGFLKRIKGVLGHASGEFFHVVQFLIIAAALSALIQTFLPHTILSIITANPLGALFTMMAFAFILSICSTSDAFIARNFYGQFGAGPIIGFMVFGAMIDIKNLSLLLGHFYQPFVIRLVLRIIVVAALVLLLFTYLF